MTKYTVVSRPIGGTVELDQTLGVGATFDAKATDDDIKALVEQGVLRKADDTDDTDDTDGGDEQKETKPDDAKPEESESEPKPRPKPRARNS